MPDFVSETVLKRDVFSETHKGHLAGEPARPVIRRIVSAAPWWSRPLAWVLARRRHRFPACLAAQAAGCALPADGL
jgi:hypothetical protein